MPNKPFVDQNICISCRLCVESAPEVFLIDNNDLAEVYDPFGVTEEKIQEAIYSCPVSCIYWD